MLLSMSVSFATGVIGRERIVGDNRISSTRHKKSNHPIVVSPARDRSLQAQRGITGELVGACCSLYICDERHDLLLRP